MFERTFLIAVLALPSAALAQEGAVTAGIGSLDAPFSALPSTGGDWTGASVGLSFGFLDADTSGAATLSGDGGLIGLRAGYDYDFGDYVLGATLQYDSGSIDLGGVTTIDSVFRLGGRAGLDAGRNWYYLTGGWARASTSSAAVGDSDGYFAGLGYEVFLTDRVTAGAEVLYHDFDDFNLGGLEAEATTVNLSVGFRF